ncbi:MAG: EAL domain-containing protein [Xanthobacteraceae bacterium]|uniref:EAL domain-containing protein n=1 Tax=Pseudolabrys sp. TaxID=1960880 RepID=UPI003D13449B
MVRISAVFIAICMVLIAGSVGAVLYLLAGAGGPVSAVTALTLLTSMALYNSVTGRMRDRRDLGDQIADLSRGTADLARQVAEIARRLGVVESRPNVSHAAPRTRSGPDPLAAEIGELGGLVKQLAETVAVHDIEIKRRMALQAMAKPAPAEENVDVAEFAGAGNAEADAADEPAAEVAAETVPAAPLAVLPEPQEGRDAITDMIVSAVDSNRIDLYLQPIVTLPQRKVRFYEAMSRLRAENGDIMPAADFIDFAEAAGLMPKIDNLLLFRCVQVVRRLQLKNRDVGLFCNVSSTTLSDATYFQQFLDFMEANRALAPAMMFEFTQQAYRSFGPIEHESLSALAERGFRFSLDHVEDLRIEPRELADRSFKFIKVPAKLLLNPEAGARADIHPQDLADLMARNGVDLIAERIETESMVLDLLDYDVRFGQGFLFSPPRPVRAEALSGVSDAVARDGAKAGDGEGSDIGAGAASEPAKAFAARA